MERRNYILLVVLFFQLGIVDLFGQNVAVENQKLNIAYPLISNPLNIVVEGIACDKIFVLTDNGKVESYKNCSYSFIPHEVGTASIFIHKIENGDTIQIEERKYGVKRWPIPKATFSYQRKSGKIGLGELKAHQGVSVPFTDFDISGRHEFDSFRFRVIRDKDLIGEVINQGARFGKKTKGLILKLQKGDIIIVDEIKVLLPGSKEKVELDELILEIK